MQTNSLVFTICLSILAGAGQAQAGTLENMERERAMLIDTLLSPELNNETRQQRILTAQRRLADLERQVMRDGALVDRDTPTVRQALQNYDLTFLVHAATEKDRLLLDHWLEQVGITTNILMSSRFGRR